MCIKILQMAVINQPNINNMYWYFCKLSYKYKWLKIFLIGIARQVQISQFKRCKSNKA